MLALLIRDDVRLSIAEVAAIAHALGELAITHPDGALAASLDTAAIDNAGRVHVHGAVSPRPAVEGIKQELARLVPIATTPLALQRLMTLPALGTEDYLDKLSNLCPDAPAGVLAALVQRWRRHYGVSWVGGTSGASVPDPSPSGQADPRFARAHARHGDQFPNQWERARHQPTWWARRTEPDEPSGLFGWGRAQRVVIFLGETAPDIARGAAALRPAAAAARRSWPEHRAEAHRAGDSRRADAFAFATSPRAALHRVHSPTPLSAS